jgi:hypothetical protein
MEDGGSRLLRLQIAVLCFWVFLGSASVVAAEPKELICEYRATATVFELWELSVGFPEGMRAFAELDDTQVHDAYDADRDGVFVQLSAILSLEGGATVVAPGFAMRSRAGAPWKWVVRWSPSRAGEWSVKVRVKGRAVPDGKVVEVERALEKKVHATVAKGIVGPLVAPGKGEAPGFLRRLRADGTSEATWLFGACRAWVVKSQDPNNDWHPHEWLDREKELFAPMRDGGFNLLNQWMAPWEFLIIHHDRAEFWRDPNDDWKRIALPKDSKWTSYQCYDQGRALAFDKLVALAEGDAKKATISLLLSPLSHQSLQVSEHPWGSQESGWSPKDDAGKQSMERLNGLSGFKKDMSIWEFFGADPISPLGNWRSKLFDHQANFFRYVIARWGYSRALGAWVLVDELDAVGDEVGVMSQKKGWWAHPECDVWLANMVRMFRGELKRVDGLPYQGDPFHHPLHAATTSYGGQADKGGNLEWNGGPEDARPDLFGWHWYPYWDVGTWNEVWEYTIDGVARYSKAPIGNQARLISEFGAPDRRSSEDAPSRLYPGLFHFAAWSAVFTGQSGTPMDWDDGKEFGELTARKRKGIFHKSVYPIDHVAELKSLRAFLGEVTPDDIIRDPKLTAVLKCEADRNMYVYTLFVNKGDMRALGWLFCRPTRGAFRIVGLSKGRYRVTWYDPWSGNAIPKHAPTILTTDTKGILTIDPQPILKALREASPAFSKNSRLPKGHDVAFKIEVVKPK